MYQAVPAPHIRPSIKICLFAVPRTKGLKVGSVGHVGREIILFIFCFTSVNELNRVKFRINCINDVPIEGNNFLYSV